MRAFCLFGFWCGRVVEPPRRHGHQLFRRRWVNRDARVQVGLGAAHLHGHAEPLQHLVRTHADGVQPNHFFLCPEAHELHGRLGLVRGLHRPRPVKEVHESRGEGFDLVGAELGHRLLFREPNRADGRVREHHSRDEVVVCFGLRQVSKQTVGEPPPRSDGRRGQLHVAAHVTESVHPVSFGSLKLVHLDVVGSIGGHARVLELERLDHRVAANRHQHLVKPSVFGAVRELDGELAR
mmetsp:Transcript_74362/g.140752  ORF Transcript_74362/g.140752 Transcript_74362/m.140752 type:complete len:237 (+) Transcript_74362:271-981(+)